MSAFVVAAADAIQKDVESSLAQANQSYKSVSIDAKLELFMQIAAERMAAALSTDLSTLRPYVTDFVSCGASIYEHHHTMDIAKKASFLGLTQIEMHSVDLGGASIPAALEIARRLTADENRLVLIAGAEVPRSGAVNSKYYREVNDALLDKDTELHTQANLIALYALLADRMMFENAVTQEHIDAITEYYRNQALSNPRAAMYNKPFKEGELKRYLSGPYATPMVAVATDHGIAILVANEKYFTELTKKLGLKKKQPSLFVNAIGTNYGQKYLSRRNDFASPAALAAERAFTRAGITSGQIDYAWVYDCFTLMLVRQAADYFGIAPKAAADTLQNGYLNHNGKIIYLNKSGGILNTQAAISLSAATGLLDILDFAGENPEAEHFLYGGNGGLDTVNAVAILSRNPLEHQIYEEEIRENSPLPRQALKDGEQATLYAAVTVRFNPGTDVPFALGSFRRADGSLCLARMLDVSLNPVKNVEKFSRDSSRAEFRCIDGNPYAVML